MKRSRFLYLLCFSFLICTPALGQSGGQQQLQPNEAIRSQEELQMVPLARPDAVSGLRLAGPFTAVEKLQVNRDLKKAYRGFNNRKLERRRNPKVSSVDAKLLSWKYEGLQGNPNLERWASENFDIYNALINDFGTEPVTMYQVIPGAEVDDPDMGSKPCQGDFCSDRAPEIFPPGIPYSSLAHQEVVLLRHRVPNSDEWRRHCSAVIVSPSHGLTALHCFGSSGERIRSFFDFEPSELAGWSQGPITGRMDFGFTVGNPSSDAVVHRIEKIFIPYAHDSLPRHRQDRAPTVDLALFEFSSVFGRLPKIDQMGTPTLSEANALTFVGYGLNDAGAETWKRYAAFNAVSGVKTDGAVGYLSWESGTKGANGGPCAGDSGGPVYLGFEQGDADDKDTVIAVVSRFKEGSKIETPDQCLMTSGLAVRLGSFIRAICHVTRNQPDACQPSD